MSQTLSQPVAPPPAPIGADASWLSDIGPVGGAHALVIGHGAIEAICELIHGGCTAATEMQFADRLGPEPGSAEIVLVPRVASADEAGHAIARARRAMIMGGRIAIRDVTFTLGDDLAALLRAHGFCRVRVRKGHDGTVVSAERPIFGPLPQA